MKTIWLWFVCAASAGTAQAQQYIGELKDTKTLQASPACAEIRRSTTNNVRVTRQNTTFDAPPGTIIYQTDSIAKQSDVLARLEVSDRRGTLYLVPTVSCYPELKGRRFAGEVPYSVSSRYRFGTRNVPYRGATVPSLALLLDVGAVIVHWNGGRNAPLAVVLPFDSIDVVGTTVAFSVSADGTSGFAYVHEGTIVVRSTQQTYTDGQIVRWTAGAAPQSQAQADIAPLRQTAEYYTDDVWGGGRGWLRWVAPLAVGGAVYAAIELWPGEDERREHSGTVIIRVPFRF